MADDQQIRTPSGMAYGKAKELSDMQRAAPLPTAGGLPAGGPTARDGAYQAPVVPLTAPTMAPGQHVMDGVGIGGGRNGADAGIPVHDDGSTAAVVAQLRGIYAATQVPELMGLIAAIEGHDQGGVADLGYAHGNWGN